MIMAMIMATPLQCIWSWLRPSSVYDHGYAPPVYMIMATPLQCKAAYWTNDFNQKQVPVLLDLKNDKYILLFLFFLFQSLKCCVNTVCQSNYDTLIRFNYWRITFIVILSSAVVFWTSKRWYENKLKIKVELYLTVRKIINNAVDKNECV
jgi:hypothetical protein